jgi:hypothetical protein
MVRNLDNSISPYIGKKRPDNKVHIYYKKRLRKKEEKKEKRKRR